MTNEMRVRGSRSRRPRGTAPASARASFHCYSLPEDVDALIDGLKRAITLFR